MRFDASSFPPERLYLVEHDVWALPEGPGAAGSERLRLGITALGIRLSGEIYMCRPKPVGTRIEQGRALAVVELAKAIVSVKAAVGGEVVEVNEALAARPELVHTDPYGEGWIAVVQTDTLALQRAALVEGPAVPEAMRRHAETYRAEFGALLDDEGRLA